MKKLITTLIILSIVISSLGAAFHIGPTMTGGVSFRLQKPGYTPVEGIEPDYISPLLNSGLMIGFTFPEMNFAFRLSYSGLRYFTNYSNFSPKGVSSHKMFSAGGPEITTAFLKYEPLGKKGAYMLGGGIDIGLNVDEQTLLMNDKKLQWTKYSIPVTLHADAELIYVHAEAFGFRLGASAGITPYIHSLEPKVERAKEFDNAILDDFSNFADAVYNAPYLPVRADLRVTAGITWIPFCHEK